MNAVLRLWNFSCAYDILNGVARDATDFHSLVNNDTLYLPSDYNYSSCSTEKDLYFKYGFIFQCFTLNFSVIVS